MSTFLFSYRVPKTPLREALGELDNASRAKRISAWNAWFETMGSSLVERGQPVARCARQKQCGYQSGSRFQN